MDKVFDLQTSYAPAGHQPTAIEGLHEGIGDGLAYQTLLGVTGSGKTFTMANVIARVQRPAIILAPNKTLAAQLYGEFRDFFPTNAVEYFVSYYDYYQPEAYVPASDLFIEKDSSINEHIEQMRLSATKALFERPDTIIVATVSSIYGLGDPQQYHRMVLHLLRGEIIDQRAVLRRLAELQYQRNDLELKRGTYRVRGEIIDVYPADSDREAIRIELFDDEIESLSHFDPLTGEISAQGAASDDLSEDTLTSRHASACSLRWTRSRTRCANGWRACARPSKLVEAQRLQQRTQFDLEMIHELGYCSGIENYSRYLSPVADPASHHRACSTTCRRTACCSSTRAT